MKKIIFFTTFLLFVPFLISFFWNDGIKEIELRYVSNIVVRVKRVDKNIVDEIMLEDYVVGVLAGEMPTTFHIEALKAQAVAARSYVLSKLENNSVEYDVVDTVLNQVYLDNDYLKQVWKGDYISKINKLKKAVNETSLEYLEYNGKIVNAMFFSTSNGYTEDCKNVFGFDVPYLKSVYSPWDKETPAFSYKKEISLQELYEKLDIEYKENLNIEIIEKSDTNRIISLKINDVLFSSRDVYNKLGLRSTDFEIVQKGSNVIIETKGYGHGVGMSQYGALEMANQGLLYNEILSYYYQDTKIKKISS